MLRIRPILYLLLAAMVSHVAIADWSVAPKGALRSADQVYGGVLGAASRFDVHLTGPQRLTWVHPAAVGTSASGVSAARYLEYRALRLQGHTAQEAHQAMKSFDAGISEGYAFHFTTLKGGRGILAEGGIRAARGFAGRGVYAGTTPTPPFALKHTPLFGWGLGPRPVRIPIRLSPTQPVKQPFLPPMTVVLPAEESLLLLPGPY